MKPTRPIPQAGMPVRVMYLGVTEDATIAEVRDGGRTLVVGDDTFTLRSINGHFVREGEPPYGTRLLLGRP